MIPVVISLTTKPTLTWLALFWGKTSFTKVLWTMIICWICFNKRCQVTTHNILHSSLRNFCMYKTNSLIRNIKRHAYQVQQYTVFTNNICGSSRYQPVMYFFLYHITAHKKPYKYDTSLYRELCECMKKSVTWRVLLRCGGVVQYIMQKNLILFYHFAYMMSSNLFSYFSIFLFHVTLTTILTACLKLIFLFHHHYYYHHYILHYT